MGEVIDKQGYLHSGDKGSVDAEGMGRITGRYKELIIGAGGENVAPVPVEDCVKANCHAISNAIMIGDRKKYNTMLITLKTLGYNGETSNSEAPLDGVAATFGITKISEAKDNPDV